ncbi:MAG: 4Fe-4S binding protein [Nitrospirae bacterium]|nr:4Fe-4S binding protein [Nitrospirota bacterium]
MSETPKKEEVPKKDMKDVFAAVGNIRCAIQRSQKFVEEFLSEPMCGKCHPCALGSYEALVRLKRIAAGRGTESDVRTIKRIAGQMLEGSRCKKGKDTAQFLMEALKTEAFKEHLEGKCRDRECPAYIMYRVIPEKCVMCGLCREACRYNAIIGEKKVSYRSGYPAFEIRQKRCVKCGDCLPACPYGAIEIIEEKTGVLV